MAAAVYRRSAAAARLTFGPTDDSTLTLEGNLAVALVSVNQLEEAIELLERVVTARESLVGTDRAHKLAISLVNLAMAESAHGELQTAEMRAQRGWGIASAALKQSDPRAGTFLHNYALVLDRAGKRSLAQQFLEKALSARVAAGQGQLAIESLASLAASFFDVGRFDEANERYAEARTLASAELSPFNPIHAELARSWCRVLTAVGKAREALEQCDDAIQRLSSRGEPAKTGLHKTQVNMGVALQVLGRRQDAVAMLEHAVIGLEATLVPNHPDLLEARRALGVALVEAGQVERGADLIGKAYGSQVTTLPVDHPDALLTQGEYGVALAIQGKIKEAESVLTDYARRTERMRGLYDRDARTSIGVFSRFASTRMFLAKLHIAEERCAEAFDWIESSKARSLTDRIADRAGVGVLDSQARERLGALEQARARLYIERAEARGDGTQQTSIDVRLRAINDELKVLHTSASAGSVSKGARESPSGAVARKAFGRDTALISFGLAGEEILAVLHRAGTGFRCTTLGNWEGLRETVVAVVALLSTPGGMPGLMAGTSSVPARRLIKEGDRSFAVILRPAAIPAGFQAVASASDVTALMGRELFGWALPMLQGVDKLILSSDGVLNLLPLDALQFDGRPLASRFAMTHVASFQPTGIGSRRQPARRPTELIVFGDPVYSTAGDAAHAPESTRLVVRGGRNDLPVQWRPLPAAAGEVTYLSELFRLQQGKTVFSKAKATAANLRILSDTGKLVETRLLAFSAHAMADLEDPELSSLVLSRPTTKPQRDAYFTAAELASLRLGTDLVFFSACETGVGRVVAGEGVLGLSVGALIAGSQATVHTLWSVDDARTAEFTKRFFAELKSGRGPQLALVSAKRSFIDKAGLAASAYWGPYVLLQRWE
jgi:tetratricopeptide (TPR) repeat protein